MTSRPGESSHHFVGTGLWVDRGQSPSTAAASLGRLASEGIAAAGLRTISQHSASFDGGGRTLVWILAESHLVIHLWQSEGFATIDLHVCDYTRCNAGKAQRLKEILSSICFEPHTETWRELVLPRPLSR
jgi:S-adenosylmethionine/arginine decarboxylase-like enzyme